MRVRDHRANAWYLIESNEFLILDINGSHSFVSFPFAMVLNDDECSRYEVEGREYLDRLAQEINNSAPMSQSSHSVYSSRNVIANFANQISEAVANWKTGRDV